MSAATTLPLIEVTPELRARVRYHLAYPDQDSVVSLASFPGQIEAQMTVDEGLRLLRATSLPLLLTLLERCDRTEERMAELADSAEVASAKQLVLNQQALERLEALHDTWAQRIAGLLRCGMYKWAQRRLGGGAGGINGRWSR